MAKVELRCENKILFAIIDDGVIEVKCRSNRCGAQKGVVIVHHFSHAGAPLGTRKYRDPAYDERKV